MSGDSGNPMDAMMDIFMVETNDFLSKIEDLMIQSEKSGEGIRQATPEIFRIMHTIKSSSAMMSMSNISTLAHKVEDLFYYIRENPEVSVDEAKLIDIVLEAVDFIKRNLSGDGNEDPGSLTEEIGAYLDAIKTGKGMEEKKTPPKPAEPTVTSVASVTVSPAPAAQAEPPAPVPAPAPAAPVSVPDERNKTLTVWFRRDCAMLGLRSLEILKRVQGMSTSVTSVPEDPSEHEDIVRENGLLLLVQSPKTTEELVAAITKSPFVGRVATTKPIEEKQAAQEPVRQFVERRRDSSDFGKAFANVEVAKLDNLIDLVGEIQILQMELSQNMERQNWDKSEGTVDKLKKLILTLQEATLSTRMMPIRETFLKMNRLMRDMTRKQAKEIQFITTGEDTEVDRSIIEHISSPLMHIIRNSVDHGIESAEERIQRGKPAEGRIELSAMTEGRFVIITVVDDGQGLSAEKILQKAIGTGLITEAQAAGMSLDEIHGLIFVPGFSTNEAVTEYSGRGVGMDVVNENLRKMNGKVIVHSEPGKGTKVTMKIPLTLAIIDTIILRVGTETCAIPVSSVKKFLYMDARDSVRHVNGEEMVLMRDECYRLLNLFDYYAFTDRIPYEDGVMIVISGEDSEYAVFASEVLDRQDVVVKPAPPLFKTVRGISGCTILGDGRISLILDMEELLATQHETRRNGR